MTTLTPEAQAAWAQAILTIVAIGVAIWVPARQRNHESSVKIADDRLKARDLANVVLDDVEKWGVLAGQAAFFVRAGQTGTISGMIDHLVRVPDEIWSNRRYLHLLGAAAAPVQQAIYLTRQLASHDDSFQNAVSGNEPDEALARCSIDRMCSDITELKLTLDDATFAIAGLFRQGQRARQI